MKRKKWNEADAQAFADGSRHKAHTFADKRKKSSKETCRKWNWKSL